LIRAGGSAELAISKSLAIAIAPRVQIAFAPVAAFEEFSGGNYSVGRGFDPGIISGDSGFGGSIELRGPGVRPFKSQTVMVRPYVFADGARIWNLNGAGPARGLVSMPAWPSLPWCHSTMPVSARIALCGS